VSVGEAAKVYEFWSKPAARKVMADYKLLRFGTDEQQALTARRARVPITWPSSDRGTKKHARMASRGAGVSEQTRGVETGQRRTRESYFHEVCFMYAGLLDIAPSGSLREHVLHSYIDFLKNSEVERGSPPEWYLEVSRLMNGATDATSAKSVA